jgi:hypothetical protein
MERGFPAPDPEDTVAQSETNFSLHEKLREKEAGPGCAGGRNAPIHTFTDFFCDCKVFEIQANPPAQPVRIH